MRKFDCNSFRITGNTNFKKKLTSFVSKSVWGNPAMKVKVETEIRRHTAGAEAVVFRPFSERLLWMNTEEQNNTHRSYFLKNLFENPNVSVLKWNSLIPALCARLNSTKIFNRCDENFTTKLSRIWACFLKYLLEFSISLTKKSITQC